MHSPRHLAAAALVFLATAAVHPSARGDASAQNAPQSQGAAPPPPAGGRGAAPAVFPAQQRPPGDPALIARGSGLYGVHCRVCHGVDLRGGDQGGPNLLRSEIVLNDQAGELIAPIVQNGQQGAGVMPPVPLVPDDIRALAAFIHSVAATMRGQGNPPPGPIPVLDVLVGDPAAGRAYFAARCSRCHSPTGDLEGLASRITDPTALQNYWISAGGGLGRGGRGGPLPPSRQSRATVTPATGVAVEGTLVRADDFYVVVQLADGTHRSFRRNGEVPTIDIRDPLEPHKTLLPTYTDKDIHDVTAYLATMK